MSQLTTHILDTSIGKPAANVEIILEKEVSSNSWEELSRGKTNDDGRLPGLLSDDYKQVNIASIVSRYYENNNYCNGSQADSVVYIHRGAPQSINNFRVRILDSTNKLATDIGSDNTIYIQINKQINKVLPAIEDNKEKSKK